MVAAKSTTERKQVKERMREREKEQKGIDSERMK